MSYCVYKHTCPNGKVYIGITGKNPLHRWNSGRGYKDNEYFFRAILKYGWENITHEILFDGLTKDEACAIEIDLISKLGTTNPEKGYNHSTGGEGGASSVTCSAEHRRKISDALRASERHKEAARKSGMARRGVALTDECKKKLSDSHSKHVIMQYSKDGMLINCFNNSYDAAKALGLSRSTITYACSGRLKTAGGYVWKSILKVVR